MICPIRKIHDRFGMAVGDHTCDKECAWWVERTKSCSIAEITKNLDILAKQGAR